LRVTETAMKVCGGSALLRAYPRYIRDTRAAPLMPPSSERCLEFRRQAGIRMETSTDRVSASDCADRLIKVFVLPMLKNRRPQLVARSGRAQQPHRRAQS
jgi:hypothetical protein